MANKRLLFVFNPHSGTGQIKNKLVNIVDIFTKAGYDVTCYPTQDRADGMDKIIACGKEYDRIVCSGGDGTLDEIVTGYIRAEIGDIPLGYIPTGSTNDFANTLGIPKDMEKAAGIAVNGSVQYCDVGELNNKTFVYVAAFGLFTDVSYDTDQNLKNVMGHMAYILEGAKRLGQIRSYKGTITCGDQTLNEDWIFGMVSNSRFVGGMHTINSSKVDLTDGEFEVMLVKMPSNPIEFNEILGCLLTQNPDDKNVFLFNASEIKMEFEEEVDFTLDGEYGGSMDVVNIVNVPRKIPFMIETEVKTLQ